MMRESVYGNTVTKKAEVVIEPGVYFHNEGELGEMTIEFKCEKKFSRNFDWQLMSSFECDPLASKDCKQTSFFNNYKDLVLMGDDKIGGFLITNDPSTTVAKLYRFNLLKLRSEIIESIETSDDETVTKSIDKLDGILSCAGYGLRIVFK